MYPRYSTELLSEFSPVNRDRWDQRAVEGIQNQENRLRAAVGDVNEAHHPDSPDLPLYGYNVTLDDGRQIDIPIETDATGQPVGEDKRFVDVRNRFIVLSSHERSRGSRLGNFSFRKGRGRDHDGTSYRYSDAQQAYSQTFSHFITKKVTAEGFGDSDSLSEALAESVTQDQEQISVLSRMAAEQKSGWKLFNAIRKHRVKRMLGGVALGGIAAAGLATGQLEIAIPALVGRSLVAGSPGGYLVGRTGMDWFQGLRARRAPDSDRSMTRSSATDSGMLSPREAARRFVNLTGAEARAGGHNPGRQEQIRRLAAKQVPQYYKERLKIEDASDQAEIRERVQELHRWVLDGDYKKRLMSDREHSRRRHVAGLVGAVALGSLPLVRGVELMHHAATVNPNSQTVAQLKKSFATPVKSARGALKSVHKIVSAKLPGHPSGGSPLPAKGHIGPRLHKRAGSALSRTLEVKQNGEGFISAFHRQYHLKWAQANKLYYAVHDKLSHVPGTYKFSPEDIRIKHPGNLQLTPEAQTAINHQLHMFHDKIAHISKLKSNLPMPKMRASVILKDPSRSVAMYPSLRPEGSDTVAKAQQFWVFMGHHLNALAASKSEDLEEELALAGAH